MKDIGQKRLEDPDDDLADQFDGIENRVKKFVDSLVDVFPSNALFFLGRFQTFQGIVAVATGPGS